jgi:hypothetical protein
VRSAGCEGAAQPDSTATNARTRSHFVT